MQFETWFKKNEDQLSENWTIYLSELEDSSEHICYLSNSDEAFMEWCEEQYGEEHEKV